MGTRVQIWVLSADTTWIRVCVWVSNSVPGYPGTSTMGAGTRFSLGTGTDSLGRSTTTFLCYKLGYLTCKKVSTKWNKYLI